MARVLVLGGGFGGLAAAHRLRRELPEGDEVTVVADRDGFFVGFAKLWDLAGVRPLADGTAPLANLERHGIRFVRARITSIDPTTRTVETSAGALQGDGLVIALGAGYHPDHLRLLDGRGHNLYDADALDGIRTVFSRLRRGRLVVSVLGGPYLCPPAPYEAMLLLDEQVRERGLRDHVELAISTPQPMTLPVAGPDASRFLAERLVERGVDVLTARRVETVDEGPVVRFAGGGSLRCDVLLGVPAATPPPVLAGSPLVEASGWIEPDPGTFRTRFDRVYAVGDCTRVPTATAELPKAGVFAEAGGTVAAVNLHRDLHGGAPVTFDGHGYCFLELPGRRVAKVSGNFYARPQPDVTLSEADESAFAGKQRWEQERLAAWLG